ncbi:hypothetical protein C8F04DRAFT_353850 [Mycena alexandri]|uniref:F-box domain-containing protein n=1 Tax=Mycena alexandri TaxID=1745969 RepID=A0AAD6X887_9AGAR|nr:hypothetical protein C8F04DRAFT_353850 [Mycena alexandri]
MHRCWLITEIVCMICEQVDQDSTLALLARTARFFQYALDLLWKEQHDLTLLLSCMPPDLWEKEEHADQPTVFVSLRRPVVASDLDRVFFYSHRVKVFTLHGSVNVAGDPLRKCLLGQALFPNITAVVWNDAENSCDLPLYLGPNLKHLGLALNDSLVHLGLLSTLLLRFPVLKSIDITIPLSTTTTTGVSTALCHMRTVNRLTANTLTPAALLHVAALPGLHVLNLMSVGDVTPEPLPRTDNRFADLKHLTVGASTIEQCTALIDLCSVSPLQTLFVALDESERSPPSGWTAFTHALREHCAHDALQSIFLYHGVSSLPHMQLRPTPSSAALVPLLAFTRLTSVVLEPPHGIDLDDGILADIARAWPCMEKLVLGVSGAAEPTPAHRIPRLRALLPFALHCPKLQSFGVVLDASMPLGGDGSASTQDSLAQITRAGGHRRLHRLLVGYSTISDADVPGVARFLSAVFPGLGTMVCARGYVREGAWARVGQEMSQILATRVSAGSVA